MQLVYAVSYPACKHDISSTLFCQWMFVWGIDKKLINSNSPTSNIIWAVWMAPSTQQKNNCIQKKIFQMLAPSRRLKRSSKIIISLLVSEIFSKDKTGQSVLQNTYSTYAAAEKKDAILIQLDFQCFLKALRRCWCKRNEAGPAVKWVHLSFNLAFNILKTLSLCCGS